MAVINPFSIYFSEKNEIFSFLFSELETFVDDTSESPAFAPLEKAKSLNDLYNPSQEGLYDVPRILNPAGGPVSSEDSAAVTAPTSNNKSVVNSYPVEPLSRRINEKVVGFQPVLTIQEKLLNSFGPDGQSSLPPQVRLGLVTQDERAYLKKQGAMDSSPSRWNIYQVYKNSSDTEFE